MKPVYTTLQYPLEKKVDFTLTENCVKIDRGYWKIYLLKKGLLNTKLISRKKNFGEREFLIYPQNRYVQGVPLPFFLFQKHITQRPKQLG